MAYSVSRKTNEIGIRLALGAKGAEALRAVLREAPILAAAGAVLGLPLAFAATQLVASRLYGLKASIR